MPKKEKGNKRNNKKDTKYNAENEIIIGVTTKPKEKVRVEKKKTTRTNSKNVTKKKSKKNSKTNINKLEKEKKIRKLNKKKILFSIIFLFILIIGGTIYYMTTPVFNISSVEVYGNEKNSIDTYISLSGININETNIFAFTDGSIEKNIKENPYVENVNIVRKFPNKLELHITERKIDYQASYLNSYIYLNNQGYVLEINEEKNENVLLIEGLLLEEDNIQLGNRVNNDNLIKLDTVLKVVNYCKYNSLNYKLTSINVENTSNYTLEFKEENKTAYIGDSSSITEKMTSVAKILEAEEGKKGKIYANEEVLKRNRVYFSEEK